MPRVSILIPAYEAAPWIGATIESVLRQSCDDLEVIVVDDGSTDETVQIAHAFERDSVRVLRQQRRGAAAARNLALSVASGEYVQYLDADDLLSTSKIAEQVEVLDGGPPGLVAISRTRHFVDREAHEDGVLESNGPLRDTDDAADWLIELLGPGGGGEMVHPGAYLVSRRLAHAAGPWSEFVSPDDDGEYFTRVLLASSGVRRTGPGVSYYRKHRHGSNLSAVCSLVHHEGALRSLDLRMAALLARRDSSCARRGLARAYMERAVIAYPRYAAVTAAALARVDALGGTDYVPSLGGRVIETVGRAFGWKIARRLSTYRHALCRQRFDG